MIGSTLGHYQVTSRLGAGGMGEVYLARDTRLNRDVALKVLPAQFAADTHRLARFQREAQVLASLNHPHIAQIYGLEVQGSPEAPPVLVMELVEGIELGERLSGGPLPADEVRTLALQIAEGLEYAHEKGIVHRDLKPANLKLNPEGQIKILDFGLARAMDTAEGSPASELSQSPTMSLAATQAGMILGTAGYMSPEQARGKVVDRRADIWAFGCILFEMLVGEKPFAGSDVAETLAAVIQTDPRLDRLPSSTPRPLRRLIEQCLRKDPRQRLRDIGDARIALEDMTDPEEANGAAPAPAPNLLPVILPWLLAAVLGLWLWATTWTPKGLDQTREVRRFSIDLPWESVPNWSDFAAVISPNGRRFAYQGRDYNSVQLMVRDFDSLESRALADARGTSQFVFSPDSEWLVFLDNTDLKKVSVHGGAPHILANIPQSDQVEGLAWPGAETVLLGTYNGIYAVSSVGGTPQQLTQLRAEQGETGHLTPSPLPGNAVLMTVTDRQGAARVAVLDLDSLEIEITPLEGHFPHFLPGGILLAQQDESLVAARFDLESRTLSGPTVPVLDEVRQGLSVASDGTLLYVPTRGESNARLTWADRTGKSTPIPDERRDYSHLDLSASGEMALLDVDDGIYVLNLRGRKRRLNSDGSFPIWADGDERVVFRLPEFLYIQTATEVSTPEPLTAWLGSFASAPRGEGGASRGTALLEPIRGPGTRLVPTSWNHQTGQLAVFNAVSDIWILSPDKEPFPFLNSPSNERSGRFSPDGTAMAFISDETGEYQVFVVPFPGPGPKIPVSISGGMSPIWSADGKELFFRKGGKVFAAAVQHRPELVIDEPVELFEGPYTLDLMGHQRYDVSPDGQRFLMVENSDDFRIIVVENWFQELEELLPER